MNDGCIDIAIVELCSESITRHEYMHNATAEPLHSFESILLYKKKKSLKTL